VREGEGDLFVVVFQDEVTGQLTTHGFESAYSIEPLLSVRGQFLENTHLSLSTPTCFYHVERYESGPTG